MAEKVITVIGSLNTDLVTVTPRVPTGGETLTASSFSTGPGGKGANQAVACARLSRVKPQAGHYASANVKVAMIGAVGDDEFGPSLKQSLNDNMVDADGVRQVSGMKTGVAVILVEEGSGENRILLSPGANHSSRPEDFTNAKSLGKADLVVLQLEIPLETVLQILRTAKTAGVDVLMNPAPAVRLPDEVYGAVTHLIVNESEAAILTGRNVEEVEGDSFDWSLIGSEFLQKGVKSVIVTLGSKGAYYASEAGSGYVSAEKVTKVVDTTAAGDTFVGAIAVDIVRKQKGNRQVTVEAVQWACRAAGRTVEKEGAQSAIPWADEVDGQS